MTGRENGLIRLVPEVASCHVRTKERSFASRERSFNAKAHSFAVEKSAFDAEERASIMKGRAFDSKKRSSGSNDRAFESKERAFDAEECSLNFKELIKHQHVRQHPEARTSAPEPVLSFEHERGTTRTRHSPPACRTASCDRRLGSGRDSTSRRRRRGSDGASGQNTKR